MAIEKNPNDPYDRDHLTDPIRRSPAEFDNDFQVDPELAGSHTNSAKIALIALGIAVVLGAVFYGLNNSSMNQQNAATTTSPATAQNSASATLPAAPPGMRDVTPRANSAPGTTTGSATAPSPMSAPANNANAPANR